MTTAPPNWTTHSRNPKRLEREERDQDMARQQEVDDKVADLLADKNTPKDD